MTVQISRKMPNDAIYVVSGEDYSQFSTALAELYGEDVEAIGDIENAIRDAFRVPPLTMQEAAGNLQAAFPQAQPSSAPPWAGQQPQQYPQVQPGYQQPQYPQQDMRQSAGPMPGGQQPPICPMHGIPGKWVNGGVSKNTGRPYPGFWACSAGVRECKPQ